MKRDTKTFKEWLSDSGYKPTIGTPQSTSGLPDFHTKNDKRGYGVLYNTVKLCIEFNDLTEKDNTLYYTDMEDDSLI